jgi:hypothetical protein
VLIISLFYDYSLTYVRRTEMELGTINTRNGVAGYSRARKYHPEHADAAGAPSA